MNHQNSGKVARTVMGFHGTSRSNAIEILKSGFKPSQNVYDWLGFGSYFFDSAPTRAREWAARAYGEDAAVVAAEISLDNCLNLLDTEEMWVLREFAKAIGIDQMNIKQQNGLNGRDCFLLNSVCAALEENGRQISSIRAAFSEGEPTYPGSAIFDLAHVQIAVRDQSCISGLEILQPEVFREVRSP